MPLSALQGQSFIEFCPSESRYLYEIVAGQLRANGVAPETVQTLSHTHSILALVDANVGVALVPRSAMKLRYANVCFKPVADVTGLDVEMHLAWRRESRHSVANTLRELLQGAFPAAAGLDAI
ncbi:DNA-binding transcriptional activator XapR [compost metagenome]